MGLVVESVWDSSFLEAAVFLDSGPVIINSSINAARYTHSDWSSKITDSAFDAVALSPVIESFGVTYLDAGFTCVYSATTRRYTLDNNGVDFALDFENRSYLQGTIAQRIMGFQESYYSGASTYTSEAEPWFALESEFCREDTKPDYETGDNFFGGNQNGVIYGGNPTTTRKQYDFRIPHVLRNDIFKAYETTAVPWTWESFWNHHRTGEIFVCDTEALDGVVTGHRMRSDGLAFAPVSIAPGYLERYHLDFRSYVYR